VHCPAFDDAKNFLYGDEVTKCSSVRGQTTWKSYVGLRIVHEHGNEEAAMESMGNTLRSKSIREGTGSFQESTRFRHCGERGARGFPVASHDMDMGRRAEKRQLYLEGPGMHGESELSCLSGTARKKQKQASNTEVISSLDAGTDYPRWWSLYRRSWNTTRRPCPLGSHVNHGYVEG
jgi:hypothetical protein